MPLPLRLFAKTDRLLFIALAVAFLLCLHGITAKYIHPDQMVFLPLFREGELPFNPGWFEKPPFHTYFSYFFSILPLSLVARLFDIGTEQIALLQRVWSKTLATFMLLGSIVLVYRIAQVSFGILAARAITLLFATSAGFIVYIHYLTADLPVMFWMLVAFYFSHRVLQEGKIPDYLWAGLWTGIATATKYNGLAVGITIVVAHLLHLLVIKRRRIGWQTVTSSHPLLLGLMMVPVGFVIGNPFSVLDYKTFVADFIYNYRVAPVYEGQTGHSFAQFFVAIIEVIGLPAFVITACALLISLYITRHGQPQATARASLWLTILVLLLYYYQFAPFPRLETRFIFPIVPLWLLTSGPFWQTLAQRRRLLVALLTPLILYNLVCSAYVGERFQDDPRIAAMAWVAQNVPQNSSIESDIYSPSWNEIPGVQLQETMSPFVTGRERLFAYLFPGDRFISGGAEVSEQVEQMVAWYTLQELQARSPDYVVIDSLYYERFTQAGLRHDLYPSMAEYFTALLNEKYLYRIIFDQESKPMPVWIYPQRIDFLTNRITILHK